MSRAEIAYDFVLSSILDRKFLPGSPLIEADLCRLLNMSRTPIREALNRLIAEKMVDFTRVRGFAVTVFSSEKIHQIYQVIEGLEGMMCYLIAKDYTEMDFTELREDLLEMEKAVPEKDWETWVKADTRFHEAMQRCCKNSYLAEEVRRYNRPALHIRGIITRFYIDKDQSTRDHREMFDQMVSGHAEEARTAAHKHYNRIGNQVAVLINSGASLGGY